MKKLFVEPEVEILKFLCNDALEGSPDDGNVGGSGVGGDNLDDILP